MIESELSHWLSLTYLHFQHEPIGQITLHPINDRYDNYSLYHKLTSLRLGWSNQSPSSWHGNHREARSWEKEACADIDHERYTCNNGKIQCLDGWIGDLCQVPVCGNECDPQHGYCVKPGECKCNLGYQGPSCRECIPLPGCLHGHCTKSFTCHCEEGWSGMFCNNPECSDGCGDNGVCTGPDQCQCQLGYQGDDCGQCAPPEGCLHGNCSKPLECQCEAGWTGDLCDTPVCDSKCHPDHGTCNIPGECRCKLGYQGDQCDSCVAYPGCVNGDCNKPYECNCSPGWSGHLCDVPEVKVFGLGSREGRCQPLGSFLCFNGGRDVCYYDGEGVRLGDPVCKCPPGYWGTWCEHAGNGSRTGNTDYISIEGVEPRHSSANVTVNDTFESSVSNKTETTTLSENIEVFTSPNGTFNSGKQIENIYLGNKDKN